MGFDNTEAFQVISGLWPVQPVLLCRLSLWTDAKLNLHWL